jgi:hypothetical protein
MQGGGGGGLLDHGVVEETASSTVQGRAVAFRQGGNVGQRGGVRASDVRPRGATLGRSAAAGTVTALGFVGLGGLGKSE